MGVDYIWIEIVKSKFSKRILDVRKARLRITPHYSGKSTSIEGLPHSFVGDTKASPGSSLILACNGALNLEKLEIVLLDCAKILESPMVLGVGFLQSSELSVAVKGNVANTLETNCLSCSILDGALDKVAKIYLKVICQNESSRESKKSVESMQATIPCHREQRAIIAHANMDSALITEFRFEGLCKHINWDNVRAIDIEEVRSNCDYDTLSVCMKDVSRGDLSDEKEIDSSILKALTVAQLSSQYLHSSLNSLKEKKKYVKRASRLFEFVEEKLDQEIVALKVTKKSLINESTNFDEMNECHLNLLNTVDLSPLQKITSAGSFGAPIKGTEYSQSRVCKMMRSTKSEGTLASKSQNGGFVKEINGDFTTYENFSPLAKRTPSICVENQQEINGSKQFIIANKDVNDHDIALNENSLSDKSAVKEMESFVSENAGRLHFSKRQNGHIPIVRWAASSEYNQIGRDDCMIFQENKDEKRQEARDNVWQDHVKHEVEIAADALNTTMSVDSLTVMSPIYE